MNLMKFLPSEVTTQFGVLLSVLCTGNKNSAHVEKDLKTAPLKASNPVLPKQCVLCVGLMESPSSTVRRQAWVQGSRQWLTLEETDPQAQPPLPPPPSTSLQSPFAQQEAPSEGCCAGKIESWLLGCGLETGSENASHPPVESVLRTSYSFEDDLSLGAEATVLDVEQEGPEMGSCPLLLPPPKARHKGLTTSTPRQKLSLPSFHLGHSMASSGHSSSTSFTASSVSEVLQLCSEDAEETLYHLGFGSDEPQVTARIPTRFFSFPSELGGINFRLFLQSQLQRLRQEDPDLSLASRFRQVEVLTAMANAFYSLYSYVSRTPLQKLAPPDLSLSSPSADRKTARFLTSVRSEPRSPVERLKDTVSKMCLYTGGSQRGSDSASPQASPRNRASLPDLVDLVLGNAKAGAGPESQASDTRQRGRRALDMGTDTDRDRQEERTGELDPEAASEGHEVWESVHPAGRSTTIRETPVPSQTEPAAGLKDSQFRYDQAEQVSSLPSSFPPTPSVPLNSPTSLSPSLPSSLSNSPISLSPLPSLSPPLSPSPSPPPRSDGAEPDSSPSPHCAVCDAQEHTRSAGSMPVARVTYDIICPQIVESVHQTLFCCQQVSNPTPTGHTPDSEGDLTDRSAVLSQRLLGTREEEPAADEARRSSEVIGAAFDAFEIWSDCSSLGDDCPRETSPRLSSSCPALAPPHRHPTGRQSPCRITVTDWEGVGAATSCSATAPASAATAAVQFTQNPDACETRKFLSPVKPHLLGKQANSFELEEVLSAGEEDFVQSETRRAMPLLRSTGRQHKGACPYPGLVVRGDSLQSDSSGYAEEDMPPSPYSSGS